MDAKTGQDRILPQCDSCHILWGQITLHRDMPCSHTVSLTRGNGLALLQDTLGVIYWSL
jgi:hypothetical protein